MPGDAWERNNHLSPSCASSVSSAMVSSGGGADMYSSGCFDSYSYRLWSLANIWTCQLPLSGGVKEEENPRVEGSAQFSCIHCAAPFPTRDQLDKHELLHSPNAQVSCKVCNKPFANVYRLQRHMISHDESAVLRKFKCPECDKAFKFKHHLKEHIRIHSGEKPFECGNCGKRFSHSGSYSSHMTSKKCLVMNLKVSQRQGSPRGGPLDVKSSQSFRSQQQTIKSQRGGGGGIINNNNNFPPILPKYSDSAAFLSGFTPPGTGAMPFYLNPNFIPPTPPYSIQNSLSHLLEQLHPQREPKKEMDEENKPSTSPAKSESEDEPKRSESPEVQPAPTGDLEAVKRILETVNATVTKQLLAANMQKLSTNSCSSGCPSVASGAPSPAPALDENDSMNCRYCSKSFISRIDLHQHERYLCSDEKSEGLAAKLEDVVSVKQEDTNGNICSTSEDETRGSTLLTDEEVDMDQDGRKVRVRSQIAEEQLQILKSHYAMNPRPKREELSRIAEQVGFPVRVVQVWFQNNRARDRREGRLVHVPYMPAVYPAAVYPNSPPSSEEPLDLSLKKLQTYSPYSSPPRSDSEDGGAVNLSRRPAPPPQHHDSSRLARILTQSNGISPYSSSYHMSPSSMSQNGHLSPSERPSKRFWKQEEYESSEGTNYESGVRFSQYSFHNNEMTQGTISDDANDGSLSKRARMDSSEPDGQFNCDLCDKTFAKHSSLARHKYEHSGQRPHKCDICTKAFKHKHHLTEHKRLHSGEKPFQCAKCLKRFSHSGSYSQHMNHRYSYCKPYRE